MTATAAKPTKYQMYVDGQWRDAPAGETFDVVNPAMEAIIGTAPNADRGEMRRAIEAARRAFDEGPWPQMSPRDRARIIQQIADGLSAKKERLRELLTAEIGCAQYLMSIQLDDPLRFLFYYAELAA